MAELSGGKQAGLDAERRKENASDSRTVQELESSAAKTRIKNERNVLRPHQQVDAGACSPRRDSKQVIGLGAKSKSAPPSTAISEDASKDSNPDQSRTPTTTEPEILHRSPSKNIPPITPPKQTAYRPPQPTTPPPITPSRWGLSTTPDNISTALRSRRSFSRRIRSANAESNPWQIGHQPLGSPPSTAFGSGRHGPFDIDKELELSPRKEGESFVEHLERLHQEALDEEERARKEEREKTAEMEGRRRKRGRGKGKWARASL